MSAARIGGSVFWVVMAVLSVGVAGYAFFHVATGFQNLPPDIKSNGFFSPLGLQTHIAASAVALLLGPFQFLPAMRRTMPVLHRWSGRIYVAACLIGGAAGGAIALYSSAGLIAGLGFLGLAIGWLFTTTMAWMSAMKRDFVAHERWMIRSFALTLAAVTLRLYLPTIFILNMGFDGPYTVIAWACWVPNILIAELFIASKRRPRVRPAAA
jgi:hypothetical protein